MTRSIRFVLAALAVVLMCFGAARAQIMDVREIGGKKITCMHSGMLSDLNPCGTPDWYAYVFVGTISAITPAKNGEKELHIIPKEVFKGEPSNPLIAITSQGACLPKLSVGDRWLFYLRSGNPIVLDFYGNISSPVGGAKERLESLRRMETIGDNGILRGQVKQGPYGEGDAIPNAHVIAHRATEDAQFVATTDTKGRYEFQPLPPGKYKLTVDPIGSFRADDTSIEIKSRQCWDLTLTRNPHAYIGGHVRRWYRSPVPQIWVLIASEDGSWFNTMKSDSNGYFHMESLSSGKYVVGINLPGAPTWKTFGCAGKPGACSIPKASLYYRSMQNRSDAIVINLGTDEKRDDIDFTIPIQ